MAEQKMHLPLETIQLIAAGKMDVEARLLDQRRKKLEVGDTLLLIDSEKRTQLLSIDITGFHRAKDFGELFDHYGSVKLGWSKDFSKDDYLAKISTLYYILDIQRLGVIGIELGKKRILQGMWFDPNWGKVKFTFHPDTDFKKYIPIKQSYGLCFNEQGEILIGRCEAAHGGKWLLPGGAVEPEENPVDTLHRELDEEVSITIKKPTLLGVQQVEFLEKELDDLYQLRFVAMVKKVKELTPDPDNNELWERKFVLPEELNDFLKWGLIGDYLVREAVKWFKEISKKK